MEIDVIKEYIAPELLVLIPVLLFIGTGLKKASWLDDKHIPVALGIIGIVLSAMYIISTTNITDGKVLIGSLFTAIVQGVLVAGCSVYVNQIKKQESTSG